MKTEVREQMVQFINEELQRDNARLAEMQPEYEALLARIRANNQWLKANPPETSR